eukprot:3412993-Pyramimonas_sp.AAC.1
MPPEMWLMPYKWNPLHPGRFWCHCRMVGGASAQIPIFTNTYIPHERTAPCDTCLFVYGGWGFQLNCPWRACVIVCVLVCSCARVLSSVCARVLVYS